MDIKERGERFNSIVGKELRAELKKRGISFQKLASILGTYHSQISLYVNGRRAIPVTFLTNACTAIGVDQAELIKRAYDRLLAECGEYAPDIQPQPVAKVVRPDFRSATTSTVRDDDFPDFSKMAALDPGYDLEAEALAREEYP